MDKKKEQLGMNPSTAAHRLRMDLLFDFVVQAGHVCYHCKNTLTREAFSIEHKIPWLDSGDPIDKFFDLQNIAFSHISCNSGARRSVRGTREHGQTRYWAGCRCTICCKAESDSHKKRYSSENRRARYQRTGH